MATKKTALIVFLKTPVLGKVKTRLARGTSDQKALEVYKQLRAITLDAAKSSRITTFLFFSDKMEHFGWEQESCLQYQGDLGKRMAKAFEYVFGKGYSTAILVGSDLPDLTRGLLKQAQQALEQKNFVMGPAQDGGYYLLGCNSKVYSNTIFKNIKWSTPTVFNATLDILGRSNCALLPIKNDIDTLEDYKQSILWQE